MAKKKKEPVILSEEETKEKELVDKILEEKEYYATSRQEQERIWVECYKMYQSWVDSTRNPFMANLFIPKVHEAVELIAAFLIGNNQSIDAEPEGEGQTEKADVAEKLLEYQWRKTLQARLKVLTWVKQGILFGNGIMKIGWDASEGKDEPFMTPRSITDVYFDFFTPELQESPSVIDKVLRNKQDVIDDTKYNENRKNVIAEGDELQAEHTAKFTAYDSSNITADTNKGKVQLLERWVKDRVVTIAPTTEGWRVLRDIPNPYKRQDGTPFTPFVKLRFKVSPLPNRAYDMGAIEPTIKIQKAFNDLVNEFFDNVTLINNKQWIKRRGAKINPLDLVRRPGGVITVGDINNDLKSEEVGDIKQSLIEALKFLDNEFQQASMAVNLLKGLGGSDTATEASLGQQNVQTLLDTIDGNIKDALSELGQMILELDLQNIEGTQTIKLFDNDRETGHLTFDISQIVGCYDVKIAADRSSATPKVVRQKQLLDFLAIAQKDPMLQQKYPNLTTQIYKKWLEEAGFNDTTYFFQEQQGQGQTGEAPQPGLPARFQGLTPEAINQSVNSPNIQ